jgi:hypothetical protein
MLCGMILLLLFYYSSVYVLNCSVEGKVTVGTGAKCMGDLLFSVIAITVETRYKKYEVEIFTYLI